MRGSTPPCARPDVLQNAGGRRRVEDEMKIAARWRAAPTPAIRAAHPLDKAGSEPQWERMRLAIAKTLEKKRQRAGRRAESSEGRGHAARPEARSPPPRPQTPVARRQMPRRAPSTVAVVFAVALASRALAVAGHGASRPRLDDASHRVASGPVTPAAPARGRPRPAAPRHAPPLRAPRAAVGATLQGEGAVRRGTSSSSTWAKVVVVIMTTTTFALLCAY